MAAWVVYDNFRLRQNNGNAIDMDNPSGTFKVALVTAAYTPSHAHDFFDDASGSQVSGTGYTAGGNALTTPTIGLDGSGNLDFDAASPAVWSQDAGGFTNARRAILYHDTGTPSTSALVSYTEDFGADRGNVTGDFEVELDAVGVWRSPRAA